MTDLDERLDLVLEEDDEFLEGGLHVLDDGVRGRLQLLLHHHGLWETVHIGCPLRKGEACTPQSRKNEAFFLLERSLVKKAADIVCEWSLCGLRVDLALEGHQLCDLGVQRRDGRHHLLQLLRPHLADGAGQTIDRRLQSQRVNGGQFGRFSSCTCNIQGDPFARI